MMVSQSLIIKTSPTVMEIKTDRPTYHYQGKFNNNPKRKDI